MENVDGIQADGRTDDEIREEEESNVHPCVTLIRRGLQEITGDIQSRESRNSVCIFRVPQNFRKINGEGAIEPDMVSIGPYHHGKEEVQAFESYKYQFLCSLQRRTAVDLDVLVVAMKRLEKQARSYYSEPFQLSSDNFCNMMLLDGCFIVELFQQVISNAESMDSRSPFFRKRWLIPILIKDLLKLENQLPLFVLQKLSDLSLFGSDVNPHNKFDLHDPTNISLHALKCFGHTLPMFPSSPKASILGCHHLLHLFHTSHFSEYFEPHSFHYFPSTMSSLSIPSVTMLRSAGIKFRPFKSPANNFLEINFQKQVLEIPPITINDFTSTILINCSALEQCLEHISTKFSEYITFISCLISSGKDVTFLSGDGIITNYSYYDLRVYNLFTKLGEIVACNIRHRYLSRQFRDVDAYYRSHTATFRRKYFSSPWKAISVVTASLLLLLTAIQALMTFLSYQLHNS